MSEIMAADVYDVVVEDPREPRSRFATAGAALMGLFTGGSAPTNTGGMILSVVRKGDGVELFRHIEDFGDDEDQLLEGIRKDLASMTADEFATRWT